MRQQPARNQNLLLVATRQVLHQFLHARRLCVHAFVRFGRRFKAFALLQHAMLCKALLCGNDRVVLDRQNAKYAALTAFLRQQRQPMCLCIAHRLHLERLAVLFHMARCNRTQTEQSLDHLCTLCAYQTADAQYFSFMQLKRHMLERLRQRRTQIVHLQNDFLPRLVRLRRETVRHIAPYHSVDNQVRCQLACRPGSYIRAVSHDRYFIRDLQDLFHLVGDVNDRAAFFL